MALINKIKAWYRGKYIPPPKNDPNDILIRISPGHYEKPLLAKILQQAGKLWMSHWKWIIGITFSLIGIAISLVK